MATETAQPRLFPSTAFAGFGPSRFRPVDEAILGRRIKGKSLLAGVRDHAPRLPGVYGWFDTRGKLVYIGKAKNLRARLFSYFRENSRDPKAGKIVERARMLAWEQTGDEFSALLRELELIQRLRPRYNVQGLPGFSRHHYICVGKPPAPFAFATKSPTGKESGCYGPLTKWHRSEDAVRRLNDWFQLRDCSNSVPMAFSDQADLFPLERAPKCLRFELGTCSGPCVGSCSRAEYVDRVRKMKAFLDGRDRNLLRTLEAMMELASAKFEFEKAAALRDRLNALQWLDDRLTLLRRARTMSAFAYPLTGDDGIERWYLIHRGQVKSVIRPPESDDARAAIRASFPEHEPVGEGAVDSVLLVAAWFRKNAGEKRKLLRLTA